MKQAIKAFAQKLPTSMVGRFFKMLWKARVLTYKLFKPAIIAFAKLYPGSFAQGGPARGASQVELNPKVFDSVYTLAETDATFHGELCAEDCGDPLATSQTYWSTTLENVYVDGKRGSVHDAEGGLITACSPYARFLRDSYPYDHPSFVDYQRTIECHLEGKVALVAGHNCHVYYHWLLQSLPKFQWLEEETDIDYYLVPPASKIVSQSLAATGIPSEKFIPLEAGVRYRCDSLWATNLFAPYYGVAAISDWLKRTFLQGQSTTQPELPILFVSRKQSGLRELRGTDILEDYVQSVGGEVVFLEDHDLADQAQMFNRARIVVAPHGSSLTNIVYMKPGAKVVELFSADYTPLCYARMGTRLGLEYHCFVDSQIDHSGGSPGLYENINVDPQDVIALLKTWI